MAYVHKLSRISKIASSRGIFKPLVFSRSAAGAKDIRIDPLEEWRPGLYPTTPEERAAAAKKYGLRVEDYEPYPFGSDWGDYPKIQPHSTDDRDSFYAWDFPAWKRDYGDPVALEQDKYRAYMDNDPDYITKKHKHNIWYRLTVSLSIIAFVGWYIMDGWKKAVSWKLHAGLAIKDYPYRGEVHYHFAKPDESARYEDMHH